MECGKGFKQSSAKFTVTALDGINSLIEQMKNKTYKVSEYTEFKVYEPKERVIQTTSFKDKVIQHCLCDNVIMPRLQRAFIYDNCAAQKGKGNLFGLDRLSEQMLQFYSKYGFDGYIRPDHGRHLWDEGPGNVRPGYGLYDRAMGIMYMLGVWDMLDKLEG